MKRAHANVCAQSVFGNTVFAGQEYSLDAAARVCVCTIILLHLGFRLLSSFLYRIRTLSLTYICYMMIHTLHPLTVGSVLWECVWQFSIIGFVTKSNIFRV